VADELIGACAQNLAAHVETTVEWSFGVCENIAGSISQRRRQLMQHYESIHRQAGGVVDRQAAAEQREYGAMLRRRLDECESLRLQLEAIDRDMVDEVTPAFG
jgi:hypothetical protein